MWAQWRCCAEETFPHKYVKYVEIGNVGGVLFNENPCDSCAALQSTSGPCSSKYFLSFVDHTIYILKKKKVFEVKICKIIEKISRNLLYFLCLLSRSVIFIYCTSYGKYSRGRSRQPLGGGRRAGLAGWRGRAFQVYWVAQCAPACVDALGCSTVVADGSFLPFSKYIFQ